MKTCRLQSFSLPFPSHRAVAWLTNNGFDAVNVVGGMGSWNLDHGKPIVSENGQEPWVM